METLTKKQLYDLVWKKPVMEIAKAYGLSDRGLAKLCERNSIPVPPRGYWARKKAGYKLTKPPLLVIDPKEPDTIVLLRRAAPKSDFCQETNKLDELPKEIQEAVANESLSRNLVKVPKSLFNPHHIVAKWIQDEKQQIEHYQKYGGSWLKPDPITTIERRRRRIISVLIKAFELRGFKCEPDRGYLQFIWVVYGQDRIGFTINEHINHIRRKLTDDERKNLLNATQKWTQTREQSGKLVLRLSEHPRWGDKKEFKDSESDLIEAQLNKVIATAIEQIWRIKEKRILKQQEEHLRWEQKKREEEEEGLRQAEQERNKILEAKATNWEKAGNIRKYVAAVEKAYIEKQFIANPEELSQWRDWALKHANNLDPIVSQTAISTF